MKKQSWKDLCYKLSGPWTAKVDGKGIEFHALTIIDPFTSWVEINPIQCKKGAYMHDLILQH
jgi:hypothetical protein